ncbi:MAG: MFS transporter [Bacillota bacterium]|nr:MFS transporter [Bacillota bacterium]
MVHRVLTNRSFLLLWLGQGVSQLGAGVGFIATLWWVQSTMGSALALGTMATVSGAVGLILSPIAGVFVDRWSRKGIIVGTDMLRALVNCVLAWAMWRGVLTFPLLLVGVAAKAACGQFFAPAVMAAIPQLVRDEDLEKANSLQQVTRNISNMAGLALGGVLVALLGLPALLFVNGIAYLASALSELFIILPPVAKCGPLSFGAFYRDLAGGLTYLRRDHTLFGVMQVLVIINFALVPFSVLLPKLVADHLGAGSEVLGYISSSQMAGMLAGALLISTIPLARRCPGLIRWGLGISASFLMLSPIVSGVYWPVQMLLYGTSGLVMAVVQIFFFSTLQRKVDPGYMGKVFSLNNAMSLGLQPAAAALSGYLADLYSLTIIYLAFGSLVLIGNARLLAIGGLNEYFELGCASGHRSEEPAP